MTDEPLAGDVLDPPPVTVRVMLVPVDGPVQVLAVEPDPEVFGALLDGAGRLQGQMPPSRTWQALVDEDAQTAGPSGGHAANLRAGGLAQASGWASREILYGPVLFVGVTRDAEGLELFCDVPRSLLVAAGELRWHFATVDEVAARLAAVEVVVGGRLDPEHVEARLAQLRAAARRPRADPPWRAP